MTRRKRLRAGLIWLLSLLFTVALIVAAGLRAVNFFKLPAATPIVGCSALLQEKSYSLDPDQAENAALISAIGTRRDLPSRAATIAIAVAMQESKLRNINYGDMDSLGLFQQRPSQDWGTAEQIMDPVYAINAFFDALIQVPGYQQMTVTAAGQAVQRSAFPEAYSEHESMARAFASALTGYSSASLNCTLNPAQKAGSGAAVIKRLQTGFGPVAATVQGSNVRVGAVEATGWQFAQWAVANASSLGITQVSFAGQSWQRGNNDGVSNRGWLSSESASSKEVLIVLQGNS
ncbi:hypothetical protein FHU41_001299 [Psychromicrobium silvestre]|uniref:Uncharacterized protein n=1 Tax=Psychromicrobium silvestre TaxID=1645614 RepID=A0A7Y9LT21_9MICC|nr:hypothetical protein [Psychromicrobium silvestre]NYE95078.1 hypothetical protein [Psychromicrobium silvestre]